jgi:hypothetical protein
MYIAAVGLLVLSFMMSCPSPPKPEPGVVTVVFDNNGHQYIPYYTIVMNDTFVVKDVTRITIDSIDVVLVDGTDTTIYVTIPPDSFEIRFELQHLRSK